jgi:nitrogen regulatory protein PII
MVQDSDIDAPVYCKIRSLSREWVMKLIKCVIRPNKIDEVRGALEQASLSGMTITEVRGHGRQKGHKAVYRGREYQVSLLPKTMIEMAVPDDLVDEVIRIVMNSARTGDIGDGRIWVMTIDEGFNIRTAARDM